MAEKYSISLEIKPHIKSYLITLYGPEPISFPRKSDHNNFLIHNLGRPRQGFKPNFNRLHTVEIKIPCTRYKNLVSNNYLSEEDREVLRRQIDTDFYADYRHFIKTKMVDGMSRKNATILFMEVYNISEDNMSFAAFYRDYNRILQRRRLIYCKCES